MMLGRRVMSWMVLSAFVATPSGCEISMDPEGMQAATTPADRADTDWPYWPTHMRIHPLTRVAADPASGQWLIELRLEFFDRDGHNTRAVGNVLVQLRNSRVARSNERSELHWEQNLALTDVNRRFFDDVTRTYLLRLEILPEHLAGDDELVVDFTSADGRVFKVTRRISANDPRPPSPMPADVSREGG